MKHIDTLIVVTFCCVNYWFGCGLARAETVPVRSETQILCDDAQRAASPKAQIAAVESVAAQLPRVEPDMRASLEDCLGRMPRSAFSDRARSALAEYIESQELNRRLIAIVDVADIVSCFPMLKTIAQDAGNDSQAFAWYNRTSWEALLVLSRHGDAEAAAKAVSIMEEEQDIVWRATRGAEIAASLRQPAGIRYLQGLLCSDEKMPPLDSGWQGPVYQRALSLLGQTLDAFPVQAVSETVTDYVTRCRSWMKQREGAWTIRPAPED